MLEVVGGHCSTNIVNEHYGQEISAAAFELQVGAAEHVVLHLCFFLCSC